MQPVTELAAHARGLRGVFCDIDDTLTHEGALVPAAYAALCALAEAGLRVVPVTGRPAGWAAVLAATWPVDGVVAENGALAYRRWQARGRRFVGENFWDPEPVRATHTARLAALRDDLLAHLPRARLADDQWLRRCDLAFDIGETQSLERDEIEAIVARIGAHGAHSTVSTVHAHASYSEVDKARMAVRVAREWWDEDLDQTRGDYLFVGDSPNDQAGFSYFPLSCGVANVSAFAPRLSPPPRFVTSRPGGHGFAELAALLLGG